MPDVNEGKNYNTSLNLSEECGILAKKRDVNVTEK